MSVCRLCLFGLISSSFLFPFAAQQTPSPSDMQAVQLLQKAKTNAGWDRDWSLVSFQYAGAVSVEAEPGSAQSAQLNGEYSGRSKIRVTARNDNSTATTTTVVNGSEAEVISSSGISYYTAPAFIEAHGLFPFLSEVVALSEATFTFEYAGQVPTNQGLAHLIVVSRTPTKDAVGGDNQVLRVPDTKIWLATDTLLPVQLETPRRAVGTSVAFVGIRRQFSDYRIVDGVAVPFTIQESLQEGKPIETITITSIKFGVTIADSEFAIQH